MKPVYIKWHDAVSDDEWAELHDEPEALHVIHTLGFLIKEDKKSIVVAMQIDPEREGRSMTMTIPKAWILDRRFLRVKIK